MNPRHVRLLVWKEFVQLRRDPMLLRIVMIMPFVYLIMFGYVVAADVTHLPTAVVDLDHSVTSRQIDAAFSSTAYFDVKARPTTEAALQTLLDRGEVRVAIVVPAGTQAALDKGQVAGIGIVVDGADSTSSSVGTSYAMRIIGDLNQARAEALGAGALPGVDARVRVQYNQTLASVNTMIPGLLASVLMVTLMIVLSQAVVKERESGTLEQMFTTPVTRGEYLAGKLLPYGLLACAQSAITALLGTWWFGVPFTGSVLIVCLGLLLFMLTTIGLGLFVSLVSRTRHQAQQTIMFVMLPTFILSGFIFPIESMPAPIQPFTKLIPLTHAVVILRASFVKGSGLADLAEPLLYLIGFAIVIFGAAILAVRRRLSE